VNAASLVSLSLSLSRKLDLSLTPQARGLDENDGE